MVGDVDGFLFSLMPTPKKVARVMMEISFMVRVGWSDTSTQIFSRTGTVTPDLCWCAVCKQNSYLKTAHEHLNLNERINIIIL